MQIYVPIVRDYCFQRNIQASDIDDIVQDVMTSVLHAMQTFKYDPAKGRFRAWFGTVAANRIKSWMTRQSRRVDKSSGTGEDSAIPTADCVDPDSYWTAIFSERVFQVACDRIRGGFAAVTWRCFEATWIHNEPSGEVAKSLGIPIHSVYVNKSRVLQRLEQEVRLLADDVPSVKDFGSP
jgi:RNA polymerase sigma factor (sigma-70 family)